MSRAIPTCATPPGIRDAATNSLQLQCFNLFFQLNHERFRVVEMFMRVRHSWAETCISRLGIRLDTLAILHSKFGFTAFDDVNNNIWMRVHRNLVALLESGSDDAHLLVIDQHLCLL